MLPNQQILELIKQHAYEKRAVILASGQASDFYIDCKKVMSLGLMQNLVGRFLVDKIQSVESETSIRFAACAGVALGGVSLANALSHSMYLERQRELPALIVRKEAKSHGSQAYLEGLNKAVAPGARIVLLEDVLTTGNSSLQAIERIREAGFLLHHVIALVDRQAGAIELLKKNQVDCWPLFKRQEFE